MTDSDPAKPGPARIHLDNPDRYPEVEGEDLQTWLGEVVESLTGDGSSTLVVRFSSDHDLRQLNSDFRGRDKTTDVLSFPGSDSVEGRHLGDIAISIPAARRQAAEHGHEIDRELRILLLHGALHCLGYDHETDDGTMNGLEREMRAIWIDSR